MKPIGPLMWEHRLIEQMVPLIKAEIGPKLSVQAPKVAWISADVLALYVRSSSASDCSSGTDESAFSILSLLPRI